MGMVFLLPVSGQPKKYKGNQKQKPGNPNSKLERNLVLNTMLHKTHDSVGWSI